MNAPFIWSDGEATTPEQLKRKRRMAEALMVQGTDTSPVQHWTQGAARVAQALAGVVQQKRADGVEKANRDSLSGLKLFGDAPATAAPSFASGDGNTKEMKLPDDVAERGRTVYDGLIQRGLTPVMAAGITGNIQGESSFDPNAAGDSGTSSGYAQWRGPRLDALKQLATSQGKDWRDHDVQLDHLVNELKGPESKAYAALQSAKTPEEAANLFMRHYERPADWAMQKSGPVRASAAAQYYKRFGAPPAAAADIPAPGASPAAIEGGGGGFVVPGAPAVAMDEEQTQALEAQITPAQMVPDTAPLPPPRPAMPTPADVPAPGAVPAQGVVPQPIANPNQDAVYRAMSDPNLSASAVAALSSSNRDAQLASIMQGNPETAKADPRSGVVAALMAKGGAQQAYASLPAQSPTQAPVAAPAPPQAPVERVAQAMPPQAPTPSASPAVQSVAQAMPQGQGQGRTVNIENAYAIASSPWATPQQKAQASVAVKMWEQQQTRAYDQQKTAEQRAWEERKLREQRGFQIEDRNSNQGFQRGQTEEQRKFDQSYKDSASSVAQGNLDIARERLDLDRNKPLTLAPGTTVYDQGKNAAVFTAPDRDGTAKASTELRKEIQQLPSYKNYAQAAPIYRSMSDTAGRNSKASDLNLVYGLGKIMDPSSVVREGEMIMVKNTAGLSEFLLGQINAVNGGAGLTPETRQAIMMEAHSRMRSYEDQFGIDTGHYRGIVERNKLNADDVIPSFEPVKPWEAPKPPPAVPTPQHGQTQPVPVNTPEEAMKLAPGTPIMLPDGSVGRVP